MSESILITGAGGQVGRELASADSEYTLVALNRDQLDISNAEQVAQAFAAHQPAIVINAAAYTQVDRAEHESELAFAINRDGVANLATACRDANVPLLHISTDYVFDGAKRGAWVESDPVAPLGVYGESKAEGEAALRACLERHIVLRTSWVFSATGNNFVKTMLRLGRERDELGVVDDQHGCPTSARSIAAVLLILAARHFRGDAIEWGTYHFCNAPETTWYGFAQAIFEQTGDGASPRLKPIATSDYPTPARRPVNSVLDCSRLQSVFGIERVDWREELTDVLGQLDRVSGD